MIDDRDVSTQMDDASVSGASEQELLDAVMRNSPMMEEAAPPLPESDTPPELPANIEETEETADVEAVTEDDEEEYTEGEEEQVEDDTSTQETGTYDLDELDEFSINVKIDGEELSVPIEELVKGYTTDASLTRKGRELGEARKALDEERNSKLAELDDIANTTAGMLTQTEQVFARQYKSIEEQIDKARADGDTYELNELKDKREQAQKNYWDARNRREGMMNAYKQHKQEAEQKQWEQDMAYFQEQIPELIPDFNEDMAMSIREFALGEGMSQTIVDSILDPHVIKMLNDYRVLKEGVSKGAAKRRAVPSKRAVPVKKPVPAQQKAVEKAKSIRDRGLSEDATEEDQMAFLRQHASRTLNL